MKIKKLIMSIVGIFAILMGFISIAPSTMSFDDHDYNAKNALEHLQVIADKPHSVKHYEAHEEVRQYLIQTSKQYVGEENVEERNYLTPSNQNPTENIVYVGEDIVKENNIDCEYDIRNVLVTLPGESKTGILLVAHYDSRGNIVRYGELAKSYGAGDDGYGVVTLLELMRYFSIKKQELKNSIYFLFTDAEETTMYGSFLEARNKELMDKVNFVINVESRGMNGAVYMFETSKKNDKVIELYNKAIDPVSYSIAPAVYSVMTNYTDFTSFLEVGKAGLNFSTLNDINDYHVPSDQYMNVNTASLQHYGRQILPIVHEYVTHAKYAHMDYFEANHDAVFFNFLPGIFVSYSSILAIVFAFICLIAMITMIVLKCIKKEFSFKKFGISIGMVLGGLIVSLLVGYVISLIVARLGGYPWSLVNVRSRHSNLILAGTIIGVFAILYLLTKKYIKKENQEYILIASVVVQSVLGFVVSLVLSGASFLFAIPTLLGIIYLSLKWYAKPKLGYQIVCYLSLFVLVCIFAPLIASLQFALSIGGLAALVVLAYLPYSTLLPMIQEELL